MPHLNDTQRVLLAHASQRSDHSLYPLPTSLRDAEPRILRAISALTKHGLVEQREVPDGPGDPRSDDDLRHDLFVTAAGLAAIGVCEGDQAEGGSEVAAAPSPSPARPSKVSAVIALLSRDGGATTGELIDATGWLPHSTRAALTGLRKKGHVIERSSRDDATCYRIVTAA
jgi:hypothetical protein